MENNMKVIIHNVVRSKMLGNDHAQRGCDSCGCSNTLVFDRQVLQYDKEHNCMVDRMIYRCESCDCTSHVDNRLIGKMYDEMAKACRESGTVIVAGTRKDNG